MNFFTDSLDLPQNEQRRCLSLGMVLPPGALELLDAFADQIATMRDAEIDEAVLLGLFRAHEMIAVHIVRGVLYGLTGMLRHDLVETMTRIDDFLRLDLDIRSGTLAAAG